MTRHNPDHYGKMMGGEMQVFNLQSSKYPLHKS